MAKENPSPRNNNKLEYPREAKSLMNSSITMTLSSYANTTKEMTNDALFGMEVFTSSLAAGPTSGIGFRISPRKQKENIDAPSSHTLSTISSIISEETLLSGSYNSLKRTHDDDESFERSFTSMSTCVECGSYFVHPVENHTMSKLVGAGVVYPCLPKVISETNNKKKRLELCSSVIGENREPCKFGMRCIYAHHENDLRLTTLFERDDAGLIDKATYRTRPCFSHISTGCW